MMIDLLITFAVWTAVVSGAWLGSRALERAFQLHGAYSSGPSTFPAAPAS